MGILVDPRNKPEEEFSIFLKMQYGRRRSKIEFRQTFGSKIKFRLEQNFAGIYYWTIETSLRNNFCHIAKSKTAAAAAIMSN